MRAVRYTGGGPITVWCRPIKVVSRGDVLTVEEIGQHVIDELAALDCFSEEPAQDDEPTDIEETS